jgi:hypothetical protein
MPERSIRGLLAFPVLALLAVWVLALYWQALGVGVLSDGWVLLEIGSRGLLRAPFVLLGYHTIPVTHLFDAVMWKLFHLHERLYELANLVGLGLTGWLIYLLGAVLFGRRRVGLLAALLFLANSSFYEVPFWSVVGNLQSLAAVFYLGGIFAVHRAVRSPRPAGWAALFAACVLLAFFTYEPAVSLLPVGLLQALLMPAEDEKPLRRLRPFALPALAVVLVVGISKLLTSASGQQAMFLPRTGAELMFRAYLLVRGCIAIFTLRGSDSRIYRTLSFGLIPASGTALYTFLVALWLVLLAGVAVLGLARSRPAAVRLLVAWFAVHMLTISAATAIVSRHFYLAAIPAALLSSWALWRGAEIAAGALESRLALPATEGVAAGLAFFVLALLVSGAVTDLDAAAKVHLEATAASRRTVELARMGASRGARYLVLVNFPGTLVRDGVNAFAFVNGLTEALSLSSQGAVGRPRLVYTGPPAPEGRFANRSRPILPAQLGRFAADPQTQVLAFNGRESTVTELHENGVISLPPP